MKVLICPDTFGAALTAGQAAAAMAEGWQRRAAGDEVVRRPLGDGGSGLLDAVAAAQAADRYGLTVTGPRGEAVRADYLVTAGGTAWIEAAAAAGLHLVPDRVRAPDRATSRGVGELMAAALARGVRRVVVGVGGLEPWDGGAGMLAALGARATPAGVLDGGGTGLVDVVDLDLDDALAAVASSAVEFATDLDIPLVGPRGVARGSAAQRGADHATVHGLEESMAAWGALLGRSPSGRRVSVALGAGAGGGLGAGLLRLGARRVPGVSTVAAAADLPAQLDAADLVLTGCRSLDGQSLRGTVVADVAREALDRALPVIVLAGQLEVSRREWITAGVTTAFPCRAEPGQPLAQAVATAAARAARTWSR